MSNLQISDSGPNKWFIFLALVVLGIGALAGLGVAANVAPQNFAEAETIRAQQAAAVAAMEEQNRHLQEMNVITESQAAAVSTAISELAAFSTLAGYALVFMATASLVALLPMWAFSLIIVALAWAYRRYRVARFSPVVTDIDSGWKEVSQASGRLIGTGTGSNQATNADSLPNEIQARVSETRLLIEIGKTARDNGLLDILTELIRYMKYPAKAHALNAVKQLESKDL